MIFMKFGDLQGPVFAEGYEGCSELDSFVFGIENEINNKSGASIGFTRPDFDELSITKMVDRITPDLFRLSTLPKPSDVWIDYVVPTENGQAAILIIHLGGVIISDYLLSVDGDAPSESLSLHFSSIQLTFREIDESGKVTVEKDVGWSLVENRLN